MIKFSCKEEEEAHALKYTNNHISLVRLSSGRIAVYDRLYFWRGCGDITEIIDLVTAAFDNPPLNPDERWRREKQASAILTLKDLGLD